MIIRKKIEKKINIIYILIKFYKKYMANKRKFCDYESLDNVFNKHNCFYCNQKECELSIIASQWVLVKNAITGEPTFKHLNYRGFDLEAERNSLVRTKSTIKELYHEKVIEQISESKIKKLLTPDEYIKKLHGM